MVEPAYQFTSDAVPRVYDELLVPRLFGPWADLLLDAVALGEGERVLDVATGPGTAARAAARRVGPRGRVVATDRSASMLAVARAKPPVEGGAPIEYVEAAAESLDGVLANGARFDVVLCQQGLQFFPDAALALRTMRGALRSAGRSRLGVAVWSAIEENGVYAAMRDALRDAGAPELATLIAAPFVWLGARELAAAAGAAGFRAARVETRELPLTFEGGAAQVHASIAGTPLGPHLAALLPEPRARFADALRRRLAPLTAAGGAVTSSMRSHVLTAEA
jgi:ubiquinone/menaquinone biosynthesis C-methylase UbiE